MNKDKNVGVRYSAPRILSNSLSSVLISTKKVAEGSSLKRTISLVRRFQASLEWL